MEREQLVSLVTAAQNGDGDAMNTLFNEFYDKVHYFALKTVKDESLAFDITQETFIEIINTLGKLEEPAAFVSWMKKIAYHQCTRYFKKKKDILVDEDEDGNTIFDDIKEDNAEFIPDEALDQDDFKKTIHAMIDALPEEQRAAALLYYFDELSVRQIAEIQGVSENTVKSRLNYARKAIKGSVEEYEKKHSVKLHALPFFPLFQFLFEGAAEATMPFTSAAALADGVAAATGASVTVSAATATATAATVTATAATTATATAATSATTATAVGIGAKIAAMPLVTKVIASITAAAIAIGGGAAATVGLLGNGKNDKQTKDTTGRPTTSTVSHTVSTVPSKIPVQAYPVEDDDVLILDGTIPVGCTYTLYNGTVLTAGDPFPDVCTQGDRVSYHAFDYYYECITDGSTVYPVQEIDYDDVGLTLDDMLNSWYPFGVRNYGNSKIVIATSIDGKPIRHLYGTFHQTFARYIPADLSRLVIPSSVTTMMGTFQGNRFISDASDLVIPNSVTNLSYAFMQCVNLKTAPIIPDSVTDLSGTFNTCPALTGDICIDSALAHMGGCFGDTVSPINLVGMSSQLKELALTANNGNVTVHGVPISDDNPIPEPEPDDGVDPEPEPTWTTFIVPAGCTYQFADGSAVGAGGSVTVPPEAGDTFTTPDYTYRYQRHAFAETAETTPDWIELYYNGWGAMVNDRSKSTYPSLTSEINGRPLLSIDHLFDDCKQLTAPPEIPQGVMFITSLFDGCHLLTESPAIPDGVLDMCNTFRGCTSLTTAPVLPDSVLSLLYTYSGCTSLTTVPNFSASLKCLVGTFENCTALRSIPAIPDSVTQMGWAFYGCTALESVPTIPASVTELRCTFVNCTSLLCIIEINATLTDPPVLCNDTCADCANEDYYYECISCPECYKDIFNCFAGTTAPIKLVGSCPYLNELAQTANNGNVTVE